MIYFASSADIPSEYKTRFTIASHPLPQNSENKKVILVIVFCEGVDSPAAADFVNQNMMEYLFAKLNDNLDNFEVCFMFALEKLQAEMLENREMPILRQTSVSVVLIKGSELFVANSCNSNILLSFLDLTCQEDEKEDLRNTKVEKIPNTAHLLNSFQDVASKNGVIAPTEEGGQLTIPTPTFEVTNISLKCNMCIVFISKKLLNILGRTAIQQLLELENFAKSIDPAYDILKSAYETISEINSDLLESSNMDLADLSAMVIHLDITKLPYSNLINQTYGLHDTMVNNEVIFQLRNQESEIHNSTFNPISIKRIKYGFSLDVSTSEFNMPSISIHIIQFRKFINFENALALVKPERLNQNSGGCPFSINLDHLRTELTYLLLNDANNTIIVKNVTCKHKDVCIPDSIKFYPLPSKLYVPPNSMFHISENLYVNDVINSINCKDIKIVVDDFLKLINNDNAGSSRLCRCAMGDEITKYISETLEGEFSVLQPEYRYNEDVAQQCNLDDKKLLFSLDLKTNSSKTPDGDNSIKVYILNKNGANSPIIRNTQSAMCNTMPVGTYGSNGGGIVDNTVGKDENVEVPKRLACKRRHPSLKETKDKVTCAISNLGCGGNCVVASESLEIDITKTKKERFDQFDEIQIHLPENSEFTSGIILQDENGQEVNQMEQGDADKFVSNVCTNTDNYASVNWNMNPSDSIHCVTFDSSLSGLYTDCVQSEDSGYTSNNSNRTETLSSSGSELSEDHLTSCFHSSFENLDEIQNESFKMTPATDIEMEGITNKATEDTVSS